MPLRMLVFYHMFRYIAPSSDHSLLTLNMPFKVIITSASRKKVLSALRRAKRSFGIIKGKGFFLISPQ